ncbi:hypothetical protein F0562_007604 [Nyssa sinensis]|uniref:Uncharacterized protein n=1 Tax=Nyssa sinensis TaxID=561372 RepID=A0A5J5A3T4_9ASTE|nr:hypothetical protein F0562_007604 [Nyssa sinensis]
MSSVCIAERVDRKGEPKCEVKQFAARGGFCSSSSISATSNWEQGLLLELRLGGDDDVATVVDGFYDAYGWPRILQFKERTSNNRNVPAIRKEAAEEATAVDDETLNG